MAKDWKKVVSDLCARPGWSQKAVGQYLGVTQQTVGEWATGKRPVPPAYKIRLGGMAGWDKTALMLEDLLPEDVSKAWAEWNTKSTAELGQSLERKADKKTAKKQKTNVNNEDNDK